MKKNKGGQPTKYRANFHPEDFIRLSKAGKNITQIAAEWDVSRESIYAWRDSNPEFSDALKKGHDLVEAWYCNVGQNGIFMDSKQFNVGAFVWMSKNVLKWHDKVDVQVADQKKDSGEEREKLLKLAFKDEKSRALVAELTEHLCELEKEDEKK